MKKYIRILVLAMGLVMGAAPLQPVKAIAWIEIIRQLAIKVIKAIDLAIQQQQNKIIWLQNAQKALENVMAKLKLDEITDWTKKQKELYEKYFEELRKVKSLISYYQRIRLTVQKLYRMGDEYRRVWALLKQDKHFTVEELTYMGRVYGGLLAKTEALVSEILQVIKEMETSITDSRRLELINAASEKVDKTYADLLRFTTQNQQLSLQRAKSIQEAQAIRELYGLD